MSVVLVGPSGSLGAAVIARLRAQGDEVRVIEDDPAAAEAWKAQGAFVAFGDEWEMDLIERASHEARTIVVFEREGRELLETLPEVEKAAGLTSLDRIVVVTYDPSKAVAGLSIKAPSYVILGTGKRSLFKKTAKLSDEAIARAVDAADDLPGSPELVLDLSKPDDALLLGLDP